MMVNKKTIYVVIGIAALIVIGFSIYSFYTSPARETTRKKDRVSGRLPKFPETPEGRVPDGETPEEEITGVPEEKLVRITDFSVLSPSLNKTEDRVFFYKKDGGDLVAYDFQKGNLEKISNITIVGMIEAIWSPARDRAAVFYLDGETLKSFLHIGTSSVAILPQDIRSFSWSPDGKSLAYLVEKESTLNLIIAGADGKNAKTTFTTQIPDAQIQWGSTDRIAFTTAPSGIAHGFLFDYVRGSGAFNKIASGFGLTSLFAPGASKTIISSTNAAWSEKGLKTAFLDVSGKELWRPGITTLPEKCHWLSSIIIYCAVPRSLSPSTIWPDEYLRGEIHTEDRIVILDTEKKEIHEVFNEGEFDMTNLVVTKNQDYLFWVDRRDGTLWRLKLK